MLFCYRAGGEENMETGPVPPPPPQQLRRRSIIGTRRASTGGDCLGAPSDPCPEAPDDRFPDAPSAAASLAPVVQGHPCGTASPGDVPSCAAFAGVAAAATPAGLRESRSLPAFRRNSSVSMPRTPSAMEGLSPGHGLIPGTSDMKPCAKPRERPFGQPSASNVPLHLACPQSPLRMKVRQVALLTLPGVDRLASGGVVPMPAFAAGAFNASPGASGSDGSHLQRDGLHQSAPPSLSPQRSSLVKREQISTVKQESAQSAQQRQLGGLSLALPPLSRPLLPQPPVVSVPPQSAWQQQLQQHHHQQQQQQRQFSQQQQQQWQRPQQRLLHPASSGGMVSSGVAAIAISAAPQPPASAGAAAPRHSPVQPAADARSSPAKGHSRAGTALTAANIEWLRTASAVELLSHGMKGSA